MLFELFFGLFHLHFQIGLQKFSYMIIYKDKIHYYSELLGMSDTIAEEDMFVDTTKTELEQKLEKSENEKSLLEERVVILEGQMGKILEMIGG